MAEQVSLDSLPQTRGVHVIYSHTRSTFFQFSKHANVYIFIRLIVDWVSLLYTILQCIYIYIHAR